MPGAQASAAINPFQGAGSASFIQADATTNTLIISANEQVFRNLRYVIDQLDARRAQVFVESLIVEVGADKAAELGIQWGAMSGDSLSSVRVGVLNSFSSGTSNIGSLFTNSANNLGNLFSAQSGGKPPAGGFSGALFQQKNGEPKLALLARALETDAKANILSMPNLITLDNEEARIMVGQNVPLITGQYTTAAGAGAGAVNPFQTIERRDIGLSLRVRPTISEGGTVKMAIYQETSSIQETTTSGLITSKRSIETHVLADDGQIIVLGGLLEDKVSTTIEKIPGLGNLPLIGNLFRYKKQQSGKTSLMVFLRPSVIRDDGQRLSMDRYDYLRSMQELSRPEPSTLLPKLSTPVLPPKELINRGTPIVPLQEENR
jgi:general secretion pathway protein D